MKYVAAIDVGGTQIKAALVSQSFGIISTEIIETPKDSSGQKTALAISDLVKNFEGEQQISALGFATPGAIDEPNGIVRWAGNLSWKNVEILKMVREKVAIPSVLSHDVRSGMVAELREGAAKGFDNSIFIPIGTGIAAALVMDGKIRSSDGYAGEIGHLNVGHDRDCICGKKGCLESISSGNAISLTYKELSGEDLDCSQIIDSSDPVAQKVWSDALRYLGIAIESMITTLSPEVIVFGGGVSQAGTKLIEPIQSFLEERLTFQRHPKLEIAKFGKFAGTIGCAMLAFDLVNP
jgi:glucokinase